MTTRLTGFTLSHCLLALPLAALLSAGCSNDDTPFGIDVNGDAGAGSDGAVGDGGGLGDDDGSASDGATSNDGAKNDGAFGDAGPYTGPSTGRASTFAVLAYNSITTANVSTIGGDLGVSSAAVSTITGFDAPTYNKYGSNSLAPNEQRTLLAQQDVTALVGNIDPRACDADYTNVVGGLTGDVTLYPGVTCMNSFSADVLVNGHITLDAKGNPNAFFIIRGNMTLTVADGAEVILANGAQACGVFWRISKAVTMGKTIKFYGNVISGTAITMKTASTLSGRALAQTAGVQLDANSIVIPSLCTHVQ
ncbi:MAG: hypothetical protein JWM74_4476 [Myxococcaceae bacterium]|nr:hypothetical protein [Myxococcaceae bacterium]